MLTLSDELDFVIIIAVFLSKSANFSCCLCSYGHLFLEKFKKQLRNGQVWVSKLEEKIKNIQCLSLSCGSYERRLHIMALVQHWIVFKGILIIFFPAQTAPKFLEKQLLRTTSGPQYLAKIRVFKVDYFVLPLLLVPKLRSVAQNECTLEKNTHVYVFNCWLKKKFQEPKKYRQLH